MNILFITDNNISPLDGGVERVTQNLAIGLKQKNINSYLAFVFDIDTPSSQDFLDKIQLKGNDWDILLLNYLKNNHINYIIANIAKKNNMKNILPRIYHITSDLNCKIFFCYHNMPAYEMCGTNFMIRLFKVLGLSFITAKAISRKLKYGRYSDKVILLSEKYIPLYQKITGETRKEKFGYIPNALSFSEIANDDILKTKKKEVLIVARFAECQKRISLALKIWQKIEISGQFNDWVLKIVGGGGDEKKIKHLAQKLKLKNISFEGKQNPIEYYKKASIFMMTSAYEGFPMTLGEAQQNGCIPIAFNSFAAINDLIENKRNGIVITNNNIDEYMDALKELMKNEENRHILAKNGLKDCERYINENIINQWITLFNNLEYEV